MAKKLNSRCPFCEGDLAISNLLCRGCGTRIESELPIPRFFRLGPDLQEFVLVFLRCRGNIREVEKVLGISYPTVCKRLDLVNALLVESPLGNKEEAGQDPSALPPKEVPSSSDRVQILKDLEAGTITAGEAAQRLRAVKAP